MAVDDSICASHEKNRVALYCQTCEVLICTKCVSHSPYSAGRHREHVYLDIGEAYDMWQEELGKMHSGIRSDLQDRRNEKQKLQSNLQKLQLALLRKKTQLGKSTKSLKDQLKKKEKEFISSVEQIIVPAIKRAEEHHKSVEYDTVSSEGLLGTFEAIKMLDKSRAISFLKAFSNAKKEFDDMKNRTFTLQEDTKETVQTLIDVTLNLHKEKYMLDRAFSLANQVPEIPCPLFSWCVIGHNSASIVWKFEKSDTVKKFHVYFKKFSKTDLNFIKGIGVSHVDEGLDKFISQDLKNRKLHKKDELIASTCQRAVENNTNSSECNNFSPDNVEVDKEKESATKSWYDFSWLFNSKSTKHNRIQSIQSEATENLTESDENKESDTKINEKEDDSDEQNDIKDSVPIQASDNDTEGSSASNSSSDTPRRIRKLSYTISTEQSSFLEPCDFLNESLKVKNETYKSLPVSEGDSYMTLYASHNKNNTTTMTRQNGTSYHSPILQRKTSTPHSRPPSTRIQNKEIAQRRTYRAHSLEAVRKPNSTAVTQPRSTTPLRYVNSGTTNKQRSTSFTIPKDTNVERKNSLKLSTGTGRMSRRDQMKPVVKNLKKGIKSRQSNEFEDENMKDVYNEKSHLKKVSAENERNARLGIRGSFSMYSKERSKNTKSNLKNNESDTSTKVLRTDSDSDNVFTDVQSNRCKNTVYHSDKSVEQKQPQTTEPKSNISAKPKSSQICRMEKSFIKKKKESNITKSKAQEYVEVTDINKIFKDNFHHFTVSKFVPGRVHAVLSNLEEDTNYIAIISARNHCGESNAAVVNFRTGAFHDGKCGRMIQGSHNQVQTLTQTFTNAFSKFVLGLCLALFMFVIVYSLTENVQSKFCKSISTSEDLMSICPDAVLTNLCSDYTKGVIENNRQEVFSDLDIGHRTTLIDIILRFINEIF